MNVLLDANVLYPPTLRDLILCLADQKLLAPFWTEKLIEEWVSSISKTLSLPKKKTLSDVVLEMQEKFPDAMVTDYENLIEGLKLKDDDDRHVFAAAIKSKVDFLLTFNIQDFPKSALRKFDIIPVHPDRFMSDIIRNHADIVLAAMQNQILLDRYKSSTIDDLILSLQNRGLIKSMRAMKAHIAKS
jgi:predicted nucleic acid-binding protein